MKRTIASRATKNLIALSVACLLLSACDMADLLQLSEGESVEQADAGAKAAASEAPAAEEEPAAEEPAAAEEEAAAEEPAAAEEEAAAEEPAAEEPPAAAGAPAADAPTVPGDTGPTAGGGTNAPPPPTTCDHVIARGVDEADGRSNYRSVRAGDTVCIAAGTRGPLDLNNFHGAPGRTITFVNHGGTVTIRGDGGDYAGIQIENSDHIRVTGGGASQQCGATTSVGAQRCGIRILGSARSLTGKVKTEHILVDHVEMGDTTQSAVSIKDNSMGRGEWVEHDVVLNHNYIHDVKDEGIYIGSSDYATGDYHVLDGVHLGHNLVVNTGRDGLQVGSATSDCTIHHNVIRNTGRNNESSHRAGVMNNKGSVCDVYNNLIADTAGWGIYVQGNGGNEIYNNVVVRAGRSVRSGDGDGDGISIHDGSNVKRSIAVWNNTVVAARGDGVGWSNDVGSDNQIRNNIVVASGGVNIDNDKNVDVSSNLAAKTIDAAGFVAAGSDDYRLRSGSPARDAGASLSSRGVMDDFEGVPRPQGPAYDIGAHELGAP